MNQLRLPSSTLSSPSTCSFSALPSPLPLPLPLIIPQIPPRPVFLVQPIINWSLPRANSNKSCGLSCPSTTVGNAIGPISHVGKLRHGARRWLTQSPLSSKWRSQDSKAGSLKLTKGKRNLGTFLDPSAPHLAEDPSDSIVPSQGHCPSHDLGPGWFPTPSLSCLPPA